MRGRRGTLGFTLIEMLVVIAVIGILAGLILAALPAVKATANRRRVETELKKIEMAITSYKAKKAVYPPDNPDTNRWWMSPLFYELTGTVETNGSYQSLYALSDPALTPAQINAAFGIGGFFNTSADASEVDNFFKAALTPSMVEQAAGDVKILVAPYKGPDGRMGRWYYNSSKPMHNPGEYDL